MSVCTDMCPFYVKKLTRRDLEVCLCKTHTNFRNCANALCTVAHGINNMFPADYHSYLGYISKDCGAGESDKMLPWQCTEGTAVCAHVSANMDSPHELIEDHSLTGSKFLWFEKDSEGKLQDIYTKETIKLMFMYLQARLLKFLLHRNHLSWFRDTSAEFSQIHGDISYHMDFSENLTLPIKFEVQSKYWSKKAVTVHTGVLKHVSRDLKVYHSVLSDDKTHDQVFVGKVMDQIIAEIPEDAGQGEPGPPVKEPLMAVSDNCSGQYKSSQHFHDLQNLATHHGRVIIRLYGVAGHGKSEVDGVGAVVKVAVRNAVGKGEYFGYANDCKVFLGDQLKSNVVTYQTDFFDVEELTASREKLKYTRFSTVRGSSKCMVMIFTPNKDSFLASPRICLCKECSSGEFADCEAGLFKEYQLSSHVLIKIQLRVEDKEPEVNIAALQIQETCVVVVRCEDPNFPYYLIKVLKNIQHKRRQSVMALDMRSPQVFPT